MRLRDYSLSAKIGVVMAAFSVLACLLVALAAYGIRENASKVEAVLADQEQSLYLATIAAEHKTRMHQIAFEIHVESDHARWPELQKQFDGETAELEKNLTELKPLMDGEDLARFTIVRQALDTYKQLESKSYALRVAGNLAANEDLLQGDMAAEFDRMESALATMIVKQDKEMDQAGVDIRALAQATLWWMVGVGLAGLALTIAGALVLVRRQISGPVSAMTGAMLALSAGDTTIDVPAAGRKDEIGQMAGAVQRFKEAAIEKLRLEAEAAAARHAAEQERAANEAARAEAARQLGEVVDQLASGLARLSGGDLMFRLQGRFAADYETLRGDFNAAMEKLASAMTAVATNTAAIRSGSSEISTAATDLSRRTEQQAASLEETAAALDEITATVKKTSEGAIHARKVVSEAKTDAERSGTIVGQAVSAMTAIEKSSQQIGQIIGVIDEIAFQTNLLALNAGVEAARAGDAGKGFAVVASEVRGLAQRSAEAAKEIKALISTSTSQVADGVSLVGRTGEALARIVKQVAEINAIVSEIAASAAEQATGLDQVNTAINQMDQVTQQNAAMVEESTAASQSLKQETEELARLVGNFRVGDEGQSARSPEARPLARPSSTSVVALRSTGRGGAARKAEPAAAGWEEF